MPRRVRPTPAAVSSFIFSDGSSSCSLRQRCGPKPGWAVAERAAAGALGVGSTRVRRAGCKLVSELALARASASAGASAKELPCLAESQACKASPPRRQAASRHRSAPPFCLAWRPAAPWLRRWAGSPAGRTPTACWTRRCSAWERSAARVGAAEPSDLPHRASFESEAGTGAHPCSARVRSARVPTLLMHPCAPLGCVPGRLPPRHLHGVNVPEHEGHHGLHVRVAASQHDLGGGPQQVGSWCWVGRGWGP